MKGQPSLGTLAETSPRPSSIQPGDVVSELKNHIIVDGFRIVIDLEKSRGRKLVDAATGKEILDMFSFFASMPIGYNHPRFSEPKVQAEILNAARTKVANSDIYSVPYANFVTTFKRVMGLPPLERLFFIDGGALAVENAIKAAMDWKVRKNIAAGKGRRGTEIIHFERAFHGRSGYTMSVTNTDPGKTKYFAKFKWPRVMTPAYDFWLLEADRERKVAEKEERVARDIEAILQSRGTDVAAVLIEPIQGEGGDNHFRPHWFRKLRELCDRYDVLLIFDEVQTGMGLTGKRWASEHFGVLPDLMAFGKKTQVCGVAAGPRLDEVKDNCFRLSGRINSTWGGNLTDMVRSTHYLRIIEEENLIENARKMGDHFLAGLRGIERDEPLVAAARGRGLFLAFDLPNRALRNQFWKGLYDMGILAICCGGRSVRFRPVLDVQAAEIDQALDGIRRQCQTMRAAGAKWKNGKVAMSA
jgi:L-lysine 6-transaminase